MVSWNGDSAYTARAVRDLGEVEQLASCLLPAAGISAPPVPENIVAFCDSGRPVKIYRRPLGAMHGLLEPSPEGWLIIVNERLPRGAQRFSIAHEGFHLLQRSRGLLCDGPHEYQEWLADGFAARLLMPRRWLTEISARRVDLGMLAYIFRVSRRAMERRLGELALHPGG
ncbi:MAG: ImmA/IrrE family metallo-endopeptidase [Chloroflexi bacterium]|nr:ImmA/IrrE family metallo-endopeptidase [Chloroflexota bacterium]MCL5107932.1 ImmA/IrrE family metallo-endopeptidase [Chloroflexota bacterium]